MKTNRPRPLPAITSSEPYVRTGPTFFNGPRLFSFLSLTQPSLSSLLPNSSSLADTDRLQSDPRKEKRGAAKKRSAMGGGNGQKSKMARERNMEKNKSAKGSQLESNKKSMTIQCKVCMQTFICTTSEVKCREHAEARHPKNDLYQCFPHLKQ